MIRSDFARAEKKRPKRKPNMPNHEKIDYVEFGSADLNATKSFFESAFEWSFVDYGDEYTAFSNQGLDGGFFKSNVQSLTQAGGVLIVFYSDDLEATLEKVKSLGGKICKEIFSFPGGRRFQFVEPGGNELAVWGQ